jgi:alpha-tubulin suppressor-like RCC1 family protein
MFITAGRQHVVALMDDGSVQAWGDASQGQTAVPEALTRRNSTQTIMAGPFYTLAVTTNGSVVCWGSLVNGEECTVPSRLSRNGTRAVFAAHSSSFAQLTNGTWVTVNSNLSWTSQELAQRPGMRPLGQVGWLVCWLQKWCFVGLHGTSYTQRMTCQA